MLRKVILFLFFLFALLTFGYGGCVAEDLNSEDYYQQFLKNYRLYQSEASVYQNVKSKHQAYQSVTSRAEYLEEAKKYLLLEINATESYTNLIRTRLVEATKILNYQESLYFVKLDDELSFLKNLKVKVSELSSVTQLLVLWQEFDQHFKTISSYGYGIKSYIEIGLVEKSLTNLEVTKNKIGQYLTEIPPENQYLKAASDNFALSEKQFGEIKTELSKNQKLYSSATVGKLSSKTSESIWVGVNTILDKSNSLILNYRQLLLTIMPR